MTKNPHRASKKGAQASKRLERKRLERRQDKELDRDRLVEGIREKELERDHLLRQRDAVEELTTDPERWERAIRQRHENSFDVASGSALPGRTSWGSGSTGSNEPDEEQLRWVSQESIREALDNSDINKDMTPEEIDRESAAYIGIHEDGAIPCEACGTRANTSRQDRYAIVKGAREEPMSELDADSATENKRVARICASCIQNDPEVKQVMDYVDAQDIELIKPDTMERVHAKLLKDLTTEGIDEFAIRQMQENGRALYEDVLASDEAETTVDDWAEQIQRDLLSLVERKQLDPKWLSPDNASKTLAILAKIQLQYGDVTARPDLRELVTGIDRESDYCKPCNKIYPKGTHQHGVSQKMNGERVCDSAELVTLNQLANFSAFDKTIPFSVMHKIDPNGTHLVGFRTHGDTTRGVKSRDYFRCQMYVKLRGKEKPWLGILDIVPAWFIRLDEADEDALERGTPTSVKVDLAADTFPDEYEGRGGLNRLVRDGSHVSPGPALRSRLGYKEIPVEVISDEQMTKELQETDRRSLQAIANERGLADYRALGTFEAFALLATNPDPKVVENRFALALQALALAADGRQFTEADVEQAIKLWGMTF
jgi:hypothetical protein